MMFFISKFGSLKENWDIGLGQTEFGVVICDRTKLLVRGEFRLNQTFVYTFNHAPTWDPER